MSVPDALGNAGPEFEKDIKDGDFDQYLIFTYGIDTNLLSWFDADDSVIVCGPEDENQDVVGADVEAEVSTEFVRSHAKIYLMWGEDRIVCWLGSFNFTYAGIYTNVEWAARFSGTLEWSPTLAAVLENRVTSEVTESWQIQQVLELVATTFTGDDTTEADALLQNTEYPYVLVHSHRSNTLKRALRNELADASGTVSLTYYSPFVNERGVELFLDTLDPAVRREDVHLTVRTCRLNHIGNQDTGLDPSQVARFKKELAGFEYQVRAPGDQGNQLRDGRDIRSGLAHQKTIDLSYLTADGDEELATLLTSANLTKNAWQHNSGNFEIGLLLRESDTNEPLHELLGIQLSHCYENPREEELSEAVKSSSESASFQEVWLEDLIAERLDLETDRVTIDWAADLPAVERVEATIYYRDILTGSRSPKTIVLEESDETYSESIPPITGAANQVIDFVEIDITTAFQPPERRLTDAGIERLRDGELSLSDHPGEIVVCDGTPVPLAEFDATATTADEMWLRATRPEPRSIKLVHEPTVQPHLDEQFLKEVTAGTLAGEDVGGVTYLDVTIDSTITPRHDQLAHRRTDGTTVEYLGYSYPNANTIRYYFDSTHGGDQLTLFVAPPLDRYYPPQSLTHGLAQPTESTADKVRRFANAELTAYAATQTSVIDDTTPIKFRSEITDVPQDASVEVHWGLRGYDRFGSSLGVDETLPPQEPHRQIWYRGGASIATSGTEFTLLTQRDAVTIKEQPFRDELQPRTDLLPSTLNLRLLSNHRLLVWLVFDREELLKPAVHNTEKHLSVTVSLDGSELDRVICPVLGENELICIPLLGYHRDTQLEFGFELELQGGRPEISYYAPKRLQFQLTIEATENDITLSWNDSAHVIEHHDNGGSATLANLTAKVDTDALSGFLFSDDPFTLADPNELRFSVNETGVLHLVS